MPYCNSFTAEAMKAFGEGLAAAHQERQALLTQIRSQTRNLLASARNQRGEAENERRRTAAHDADARRLFTSELRSEVHALRNRFELARRDTATDLQHMAAELRAARDAVRSWAGRTAHMPAHHPPKRAAKAAAHDGGAREGNPLPRHEENAPPAADSKKTGSPSRRRNT